MLTEPFITHPNGQALEVPDEELLAGQRRTAFAAPWTLSGHGSVTREVAVAVGLSFLGPEPLGAGCQLAERLTDHVRDLSFRRWLKLETVFGCRLALLETEARTRDVRRSVYVNRRIYIVILSLQGCSRPIFAGPFGTWFDVIGFKAVCGSPWPSQEPWK